MNKQEKLIWNKLKNEYADNTEVLDVLCGGENAREKQMPKKPEYDCYKHLYICPHCGEYIVTYNQEFPYEIKCGGRLEW